MEPKEHTTKRKGKEKRTTNVATTTEGLAPPTPSSQKTANTAELGQLLRLTQKGFFVESQASNAPTTNSFNLEEELEWLRVGLEKGYNTPTPSGDRLIGDYVYELLEIDKGEYTPNSLDAGKRAFMDRIHALQEHLAECILQAKEEELSKFYIFVGKLPYSQPGALSSLQLNGRFIRAILHAAGRMLGDTNKIERLYASMPQLPEKIHEVLPLTYHLSEVFEHYHDALLYKIAWGELVHFSRNFIDIESMDLTAQEMALLETTLEVQKGIGVGVNVFKDPGEYRLPNEQQMTQALDTLVSAKTNIIPGGSDTSPIHYQIHITKGMRLHDIWAIKKVAIIGQHPQPITIDSPLYLHIAMEREGKPPFYAFYNMRSNELHLQIPDATGSGSLPELHLHIYALLTDLRHLERRGISVREEDESRQHYPPSEKLRLPQKRSFVVSKEGIHEGTPQEPTGLVYVTPREATLPYGSRFVAALAKLQDAKARNDQQAIDKAQQEVDMLSRHLPSAKPENIEKYRKKAEALGLDPATIRVRENRIYAAPRQGFDQPIFTEKPPDRRDVQLIPSFGSHVLALNELFSTESTTPNTS